MKSKIAKLNELAEKVSNFHNQEKSIVHCHGVFDLLHIGHIKYFQEAKSMGDMLVVTITPDRFVNKGPGRPAFNEKHRMEAIAALDVVDYVAINEWTTAIETIKLLKPDLYVKGPDYKDHKQDVTGNIKLEEDAVKSVGGKIAFTSDITFSSSFLINQRISQLTDEQKKFLDKLKERYNFKKITEYIDSLKKLKVLLVGEVIIDEYVFCNTIGKSGKEPVLVNQKINTERYAGGILAVANQVSDFYKEAKILSYLGDRDNQNQFIKENLSSNIDIDCVYKSNSPTILKTRFIDNYTKTKTLGVYDVNDNLLNKYEEADFCSKLDECINQYDVVNVVDYGHGLITPKIVKLLEEKSNFLSVNTQLNSFNIGYHTISKYKKVNYVCVHEGELRHDYRNRSDTVEHLVKSLSNRIRSNAIVITQGTKGSLAFDNSEFTNCPAYATRVVDRVGAGDTLLAITSLCFAAGIPTDLTLFIGNLAAAETVASIGVGTKLSKINFLKSIESLLK
ncbi:adenylyltransferase/cytidyltransferase family protein [candidate division KSB1 bacterium]|nr:adenylyltransferase/cytidyltransferase family protein [candidate division KSB1 bacterium]